MIDFYTIHAKAMEVFEVYVDDIIATQISPDRLKVSDVVTNAPIATYMDDTEPREVVSYMRHRRFADAVKPYVKLRIAACNIRLGGGLKKEDGDIQWALKHEQSAEAMMEKLKEIKLQDWELNAIQEASLTAAINKAADFMADHA